MPTIHLTKDEAGRLVGVTEIDNRAYQRFIDRCIALTPKESLKFSWVEPRSGPYHRRFFAMINTIFDNQEHFDDVEHFRKWAEVGAGYVEFLPGSDGQLIALPKSIKYEAIDQIEMEGVTNSVFAFLRTEPALKTLWPALTWERAYTVFDNLMREFE